MTNNGDSEAASSSNLDEEIKKLMGKGKVNLVCNEFLDAVKCFEEATKKLDEKYGQAADECGEAYFYYGKSLLEVARMEGGVLGNALQGTIDTNIQENGDDGNAETKCEHQTEEGKTDEQKAGISEENKTDDEKMKENDIFVEKKDEETETPKEKDEPTVDQEKEQEEDKKADENKKETSEEQEDKTGNGVDEAMEDISEKEDEGKKTEVTKKDDDNIEETTKEQNNENEEDEGDEAMDAEEGEDIEETEQVEEEPTYMELSWQMLEIARIIFSKRDTKEGKLMLGQCHLKLGEIQMEQEQFLGAVEDFLKCMDIQKEFLSPGDRLLAETAYNIGLAFSFQSMYEKSKDYYSQALETIGLRIKSIESSIAETEAKSKGKEKATPDNPFVANRKELQELQELYPEIKAKVDDSEEMIKQSKAKSSVSSSMGNGSTTTIGFGQSSSSTGQPATLIATKKKTPVAVTDISHLVHRNKRKPEEADDDDIAAKKPRQDPETTESNGKTETANGNAQAATTET